MTADQFTVFVHLLICTGHIDRFHTPVAICCEILPRNPKMYSYKALDIASQYINYTEILQLHKNTELQLKPYTVLSEIKAGLI